MRKLLAPLILLISNIVGAQTINQLDPTQVYNTGNLVNNNTLPTNTTGTWQNIGLWNQGLPCWAPGGAIYCGPLPYFNQGSLNYSYGVTDVYQVTNIANALPNSGTGLRVNGYNFGFLAKNGNGWDGTGKDTLSAYVNFYGPDGKIIRNDYYNLNYQFDWWQFNYSKTFETPYVSKDLSTVRYGFIGGDTSNLGGAGWAGPYGPEVTNISFSLKYSVDPCFVNVLSSPTCPGYLDALNKLLPTPTLESTPITTTSISPTTTTTITIEPTTVTTTNTTSIAQPSIVAPVVSTAPMSTTSSSTTQSNKESSSTNTSLALSIISKNQERDSAALSISQNAISQANQVAQQSQQEASAIAANSVANSQTANIVSTNGQQISGNGIRVNIPGMNLNATLSSSSNTLNPNSVFALGQQTQNSIFNSSVTTSITEQPQSIQVTLLTNTNATTTAQNYAIIPTNFLTDRTNPLTDIIEGRQITSPTTSTTSGPSVNQNTGDNDAAAGVNITKMATAPVGYNDYLNFTLRDVAFYPPKEVYRNQRTIDNARALRQLTNDSKHREMVEMQYGR